MCQPNSGGVSYGEAFAIPRAHIEEALHAPPYQPTHKLEGGSREGPTTCYRPMTSEMEGLVGVM